MARKYDQSFKEMTRGVTWAMKWPMCCGVDLPVDRDKSYTEVAKILRKKYQDANRHHENDKLGNKICAQVA